MMEVTISDRDWTAWIVGLARMNTATDVGTKSRFGKDGTLGIWVSLRDGRVIRRQMCGSLALYARREVRKSINHWKERARQCNNASS